MNYTLLGFYSNIFGFVMGGLSLLGVIIRVFKPHLPRNKIKALDTLLQETETTLKEVVEEGFLAHEFALVADRRLTLLKADARDLRLVAHKITSLRQDFLEFIGGTSNAIGITYTSLQMQFLHQTSSEERRRRLHEMSWITPIVSPLPASPTPSVVTLTSPNLPPTTKFTRPSFCLPALSTSESADQAVEDTSLGDTTQINSDVRTTDAPHEASIVHTSVNLEAEAKA